nr:unnamed protein product [Spirometra erinaceieuropaei]
MIPETKVTNTFRNPIGLLKKIQSLATLARDWASPGSLHTACLYRSKQGRSNCKISVVSMCGRTACALHKKSILSRLTTLGHGKFAFHWADSPSLGDFVSSYNKAPGSLNPVIISAAHGAEEKTVQVMYWGLIPPFVPDAVQQASKPSRFCTANARADTLFERPAYRESLRRGWRCVVIAQGFYEWKTTAGRKQPHFISVDGGNEQLLLMAGLFSVSKARDLFSYTIITTDAVNEVASIHNRMPIIFGNLDDAMQWVHGGPLSASEVRSFLSKMIAKLAHMNLLVYPVTPMVNSSAYDDPVCIKPQEHTPSVSTKLKTTPSKTLDAFMIISPKIGAVRKKEEEDSFKPSPPQSSGELPHARKRSFTEGSSISPPKYMKSEHE